VRKSYYHHFSLIRFSLLALVVLLFLLFYACITSGQVRGCHHHCGEPNCIWGSRWILLLGFSSIIYSVMIPLMYKMSKLKIQEKAGILGELKAFMAVTILCFWTNVPVVVLVDYGVISGTPYYTLISITLNMTLVAIFYIM